MIREGVFPHLAAGRKTFPISEDMKSIISYRNAVNPGPLDKKLLMAVQ